MVLRYFQGAHDPKMIFAFFTMWNIYTDGTKARVDKTAGSSFGYQDKVRIIESVTRLYCTLHSYVLTIQTNASFI